MKCYMKQCINNDEWACMHRSDCDECTRGCKHYYKCNSCDYYMDDDMENENVTKPGKWNKNISHWQADIQGDEDDRRLIELCKQKLNELKN